MVWPSGPGREAQPTYLFSPGRGGRRLLVGVLYAQLAIAWVLAKGESLVPVIGARTRAQLTESLGTLRIALSPEDVAHIEEAVPASAVAGSRYDERQMRMLDSERTAGTA